MTSPAIGAFRTPEERARYAAATRSVPALDPELVKMVERVAEQRQERDQSSWPRLDRAALYGLPGEVVATLDPHTEADLAAVLVSFLVTFGAAVNAGPRAIADGADHPARLFAVLVGATSRGRKGTAWANVRRLFAQADPGFTAERILGGLASGEGLIAAVEDGTSDKDGNVPTSACWSMSPSSPGCGRCAVGTPRPSRPSCATRGTAATCAS